MADLGVISFGKFDFEPKSTVGDQLIQISALSSNGKFLVLAARV